MDWDEIYEGANFTAIVIQEFWEDYDYHGDIESLKFSLLSVCKGYYYGYENEFHLEDDLCMIIYHKDGTEFEISLDKAKLFLRLIDLEP